ncbi:hypothetical protein QYE76_039008 [Lolium multiflorum]|uniref:Protein FAR1-RELATED SEQUENCE n=1 Tax=Lolium multiflorum TaxID=4521 RepID=A0AAD8T943_LOLMU|nr:hypothetical protein QYE76_039008 [Lolium multiflorum]
MLTDQCRAMEIAIGAVLPLTKHRWCKWHVLRKAKENLGPVYAKNAGFRDELHKICHHMLTIDEFESAWGELIGKYALQDHPFFDPDIRCPPEMGETILLRSILR